MNKLGYCIVGKSKIELLDKQPVYPDYICNFSTTNYFTLPDSRQVAEIWDGCYIEHIIRMATEHLTNF